MLYGVALGVLRRSRLALQPLTRVSDGLLEMLEASTSLTHTLNPKPLNPKPTNILTLNPKTPVWSKMLASFPDLRVF